MEINAASFGGTVFVLVFAAIWLYRPLRDYPKGKVAGCFKFLLIMGAFGFFGTFVFATLPVSFKNPVFRYIELPALLGTMALEAPDGQRYTFTDSLSRIQRYNARGQFELGWFSDAEGGAGTLGLTKKGNVAVASARPDHVEIFLPEGVRLQVLSVKSFPDRTLLPGFDKQKSGLFFHHPMRPRELQVQGLSLAEPHQVGNPWLSFVSLPLFPLMSPLLAWFMAMIGAMPVVSARYGIR